MGSLETAKPLDDERNRLSEELAFEAERASARGDVAESIVLYTQAAELEESAARDVPVTSPRVRRVLGESAAALWHKAGNKVEAERVAAEFQVEI